ncbi:DUF1127 domain-containing protein [Muricoccus aerilatus]|uniref:DUF1127 domain-containing protein n=1 Tax=Muricoccus aerilatus TaxID=452982 RepID=UPI0005C23281|nr:DUF1127 domain-containing protein [Roseomonas aerilata]
MNPRISQAHNPAPMMPHPANLAPISNIELLRQANEARNAVITSALQRMVSGFAAWMQRRRAEAELLSLTDRELADIGITRSDIPSILSGRMQPEREVRAPRAAVQKPVPAAANDQRRSNQAA